MADDPTTDERTDDQRTHDERTTHGRTDDELAPARHAFERSGGHRVTRQVELPAGTGDVWEALTDADEVEAWFGAALRWELRPGGPLHVGVGDDGSAPRRGEVDEVAPGRRLRFRWWPSDGSGTGDDGASVVTYDLEEVPGGTRLVVTEEPVGAPTASLRAAGATSAWDTRLVGLWLGHRAGSLVRA